MATPLLAAWARRAATVVRPPLRQQHRHARGAVAWSMAPLARAGHPSMLCGPRSSVASARRRVSTTTRPRCGNDRNNRNKRTQPSGGDAKGGSGSGPKNSNRGEAGSNRGTPAQDGAASNGGVASSNGHSASASAGQQGGGVHANGYSSAVGDGAHAAGADGAGSGTAAFSRVYEGGQQAASAVLGAEQVVMTRLHLENKNKFRATVAGVALVTVGTVAAFWDDITHWMTKETTKVTSDVMNDEEFQASVQSLAKHVVDEVLRDPGLFSQAKDVVVTLLVSPDTQATLLQLFKDTLRNEQMVQEVQALAKGVVLALLSDKETLANFVEIVKLALRDPSTQAQVAELAKWLLAQPITKESLVALLNSVLEDPGFRQNVTNGLVSVAHDALDEPTVREHAMDFMQDVLADPDLQRRGGSALRGIVWNALPGWAGGGGTKPSAPPAISAAQDAGAAAASKGAKVKKSYKPQPAPALDATVTLGAAGEPVVEVTGVSDTTDDAAVHSVVDTVAADQRAHAQTTPASDAVAGHYDGAESGNPPTVHAGSPAASVAVPLPHPRAWREEPTLTRPVAAPSVASA